MGVRILQRALVLTLRNCYISIMQMTGKVAVGPKEKVTKTCLMQNFSEVSKV